MGIAGLPGKMVEAYTLEEFRAAIGEYRGVTAEKIRENLAHFLRAVVPVCGEAGVYLAIHPDDPPRPILGLPAACSTRDDVAALLSAVDSRHNGITKSLPPAPETGNGPAGCTFSESDHLDGDVDMYAVMTTMLKERLRREREGWGEMAPIPFRPDHGHKMLDDLHGKKTNPGYTCIGRMRGLAELRGLQRAIARCVDVSDASEPSAKGARTG